MEWNTIRSLNDICYYGTAKVNHGSSKSAINKALDSVTLPIYITDLQVALIWQGTE